MLAYLRTTPALLLHPRALLRSYSREALRSDLMAGATVGVVLLPQALAFSLLAGLPPVMGLYSAIVAAIVGALWGSSSHLHSGPTNTASILTLSVLLPIAEPGSPQFMLAASLIAFISGLFRLLMGMARLGILINFVSDSVAVGFTAGAGILIISNQLEPLLRLDLPNTAGLVDTLRGVIEQIGAAHVPSLALGVGTIAVIFTLQKIAKRLPAVLIGIAALGLIAWLLGLEGQGVRVLGELPQALPPLAPLPLFDLELIGELANGALALAIIGLVEAVSIARAIAGHSRQRLDSNQEFVGQGLANIAAGVFSGYPCSGSFNRSALSYQAGSRTALGNVFSGVFVLAAMFAFAPLIAQLPRAVLAGALALTAYSMIDQRSMKRIWQGARGDAVIMMVTLASTLLLPLQFAVLAGVLMSLGYYIVRTSTPQVLPVLPDDTFRHWRHQPNKPNCPELGIVDILGDLYFGAVNHVEERLYENLQRNPSQRFLLLRLDNVQRCDISGIRMLENVMRTYRDRGGHLFFVRVREPVLQLMQTTGFYDLLGEDHFLAPDTAISYLFHKVIDPAICIYECEVRAFLECQNLPKRTLAFDGVVPIRLIMSNGAAPTITPHELWERLRDANTPLIVDVREPREFRQGHVPQALSLPLPQFLTENIDLPQGRKIVMVCRSGRRSARAAVQLIQNGYPDVAVLEGGMLAWQAANLLEAIPDERGATQP